MGTKMFSKSKEQRRIRQSFLRDRQNTKQKIEKIYHDRYQIKAVLGKGGMGKVFLAQDIKTGKKVAVKIVEDQYQWEREREILMKLKDIKEIPELFFAENKQEKVLVMEYISGKSLKQYKKIGGKLRKNESLLWMIKLASILERIHQKGIIHMDLKPENIIITSSGKVYLIDFGVSLFEKEKLKGYGTKKYASKKQAKTQGEASVVFDIYSFGKTMESVLKNSSDIKKIIKKCLSEDEGEGYENIRKVKKDLKLILWKNKIKNYTIIFLCMMIGRYCFGKVQIQNRNEEKMMVEQNDKIMLKRARKFFYGDDQQEKDLTKARESFEKVVHKGKKEKAYLFLLDFLSGDHKDIEEEELWKNVLICQRDVKDFWSAYFYLHFYVAWCDHLTDDRVREMDDILTKVQSYAKTSKQKQLLETDKINLYESMAEAGQDLRFLEETNRVFTEEFKDQDAWELYKRRLSYLDEKQNDISKEFEAFIKRYPKVMEAYIEYSIYLCQHNKITRAKEVYLEGQRQTGMTSERAQGLRRKLGL